MTEDHDDYTLTYDHSEAGKERIFQIALKWFKKVEHYNGESLQQSDDTFVEAPDILTQLAEKGFRFKTKWKD